MVSVEAPDGTVAPLPGLAPVAMQQGRYAARLIDTVCADAHDGPFHYVDKGNLATIGRSKAVADVKGIHAAGFTAWVALAHRPPLLPDRLREQAARRPPLVVSFVTHGRGARLIGGRP